MSSSNIVVEWLRSLHLGQYAESFIDNGYDDLEICKQVGDPDLDAIGVLNPAHRSRLLHSVRTLREEGAASVYFTLEETTAMHEECQCDSSSARSSRTSSGKGCPTTTTAGAGSSPAASSSAGSAQELGKYLDEYEEGKAELVKIPRIQLKLLLKERLSQDGVRLSCQPYSTSAGERGYLEGLASRYADQFNTHYGDVLDHLEDLRRREWDELSPRIRVLGGGGATPSTPTEHALSPPPAPGASTIVGQHTPQSHHGLTTSHSQPIYVPGKYSPSSCLSDKEEDEIYGFGYGVFGKQMLQRQQQQKMIVAPHVGYQSCLSPRSAYFYEFPPTDQSGHQAGKKKTSFSRFLRGLKTAHRKEKHGSSSPRHGRARAHPMARMGALDSVGDGMLPSIVDPRDYDRLRFMQMNGGTGNSFEETIHRLKVQEVLKKRERFHKEHEEILRDIRQGLLQIGREGGRTGLTSDDTYMYDDDARCAGMGQHWYDEPPYESDPEDFLMGSGGQPVPTATIQNGRVCFTLNLRAEPRGEGVITLRSAGDISLPREPGARAWVHPASQQAGVSLTPRGSARRGLLLPQSGPYPATIIPLGDATRSSRDRESGDYAGSDVQSIGSRLSTMSIDTSRSEQMEGASTLPSPSYMYPSTGHKTHHHSHKMVGYTSHSSTSPSSDYEDQEEGEHQTQQLATVHASDDGVKVTVEAAPAPGRIRGLQKKIARAKLCGESVAEQKGECAFPSASSLESLPTGSGSSTQALVPAGSNHSSLSAEDRDSSPLMPGGVIGKARALVDYIPSPYDKDALRFKKGEVIDVLAMNPSGLWKGTLHGRVGVFKFINVEVLGSQRSGRDRLQEKFSARGKPQSVEELLQRINLEEHISVFVLNGYEDLELFKDLEEEDLDYLGINNPEHRAKILTAVDLLHDYDSPDSPEDTDGESPATSSDEAEGPNAGPSQHEGKQPPVRHIHFPRELELSAKERLHSHHRHRRLLIQHPAPHPHHHHHAKRSSPMCGAPQNLDGLRAQLGPAGREVPNNLGSDVTVLQQRLLAEERGCSPDLGADPQVVRQRLEPAQEQQLFHPNIPVTTSNLPVSTSPSVEPHCPASASSSPMRTPVDFKSDSYVVARGKLVTIESCRKNVSPSLGSPMGSLRCNNSRLQHQVSLESPNMRRSPSSVFACIQPSSEAERPTGSPIIEDSCETNPKLTMVKFVVGGNTDLGLGCESGNVGVAGGKGGCFSEKSSDSGVSSSSLSSANPRENSIRKENRGGYVASTVSAMESPTRAFHSFGSIGNSRASANKSQSHKFQSSEKNSYQ